MSRNRWWPVLVLLLGLTSGAEATPWGQMKAGMSSNDVRAVLGDPLLRSNGRGFEVWIYDRCTEVVWLRGVVVAWTPPAGEDVVAGREINVQAVLEQRQAPAQRAYVPRGEMQPGYEPSRRSRSRLRGFN